MCVCACARVCVSKVKCESKTYKDANKSVRKNKYNLHMHTERPIKLFLSCGHVIESCPLLLAVFNVVQLGR